MKKQIECDCIECGLTFKAVATIKWDEDGNKWTEVGDKCPGCGGKWENDYTDTREMPGA
jgi:hypothetical protein